jgi:hypothetical protein
MLGIKLHNTALLYTSLHNAALHRGRPAQRFRGLQESGTNWAPPYPGSIVSRRARLLTIEGQMELLYRTQAQAGFNLTSHDQGH